MHTETIRATYPINAHHQASKPPQFLLNLTRCLAGNVTVAGVPLFNKENPHQESGMDVVDSYVPTTKTTEAHFQLINFINGTFSLEETINTPRSEQSESVTSEQSKNSILAPNTEEQLKDNKILDSQNVTAPKKRVIKRFEKVIVIGDSLSDSEGNMLKKTGGLLPSAPQYFNGRFTNGYTWAEFLTSPNVMQYGEHKTVQLINKAEGGAVAASYSMFNPKFDFISNMEKQIKGIAFDEKDLAIIALGSNDYMTFHKIDVEKVINDHRTQIEKMIAKGAKNIVVMGVGDLSKTPSAKSKGTARQAQLSTLSTEHNHRLKKEIEKIQEHNENIKKMNQPHIEENERLQEKINKLTEEISNHKMTKSQLKTLNKQLNDMIKQQKENTKRLKPYADNIVYFDLNNTITKATDSAHKFNEHIEEINTAKEEKNNFIDKSNRVNHLKPYILDRPFSHGYIGGKQPLDIAPKYLFNDAVHPTQELHAIVAMELHDFIIKKFQ